MAVADFGRVTAITRSNILPNVSDAIVQNSPGLHRFLNKAKPENGGTTLNKIVRYANSTQGGGYAGLDTLNAALQTTRTQAQFDWRQVYMPIAVSNIEVAKNGGQEKVEDLVALDMEDAKLSMEENFSGYFYGDGTGDNNLVPEGLVNAVDDGTNDNIYGGINRTNNVWWKGSYAASAGAFAVSLLSTRLDDIEQYGEHVDLHLTTLAMWTAYEQTLHPQARFNFDSNGFPKADGGFDKLTYRGQEVLKDPKCTAGFWYMLNSKTINYYFLPHPKHGADKRGFAMSDLREPTNQDGQIGFLLWYGAFVNTNPRHSGVIRGLT